MTIEEMKARKIELGLTNEMISKETGIPVSTVKKIFDGTTKAPRKATIDALTKLLEKPGKEGFFTYTDFQRPTVGMLEEPPINYSAGKKLVRYTIEDYYALPEDQRVELIDGVFYDMGAPALIHQKILTQLHLLFEKCVEEHQAQCEVYLSPCDVRLDMDDYTMVQPDLLVMCREYDIHAIRFEGAPDLVVEILSPSTRSKDMILKLYKYKNAGVREYWIIDPKNQKITVHNFEPEENYTPVIYSFDDVIPIGISSGECSIDFSKILEKIRRYYE